MTLRITDPECDANGETKTVSSTGDKDHAGYGALKDPEFKAEGYAFSIFFIFRNIAVAVAPAIPSATAVPAAQGGSGTADAVLQSVQEQVVGVARRPGYDLVRVCNIDETPERVPQRSHKWRYDQ